MLRSLQTSAFWNRLARTAPVVIGSVVLHAGVAMALVASAGAGGHGALVTLPSVLVDVEVPVEAPLLEPVKEETPPNLASTSLPQSFPTHTHPYPVPPSHDAHPHDPSLKHDEHDDDHPHTPSASAPAPAEAASVHVADEATLPHFTIASGAGLPSGGAVSAHGSSAPPQPGDTGTGATSHGDDDAIVAASGVQVTAKLVSSVIATYPSGARSDDVEGDVGVEIVVDREGRVIDARVVNPAGHGFDAAALTAIRRYRFSPAQRGGHPVRVRMPWSVQFRLR